MWRNKMIQQGFNYADSTTEEMTEFFETSIENMEPKEEKIKIFSWYQEFQGQEI